MSQTIIQGDSAQILKTIESNTIDAVVTDPPYGIEFLGKEWDSDTGAVEIWRECLRVLKPGGHLLAFSAARTYHHLATNIESVGFEIRDQIMWIYASGFPKAQDIGKAIQRRQGVEKQVPSTSMRASAAYKCEDRYGKQNAKAVGFSGMDTIPTSPEAQQWSGWKTALKPAHEPIVMARKPMRGSTIDNVLTHGVGALNIDACRIPTDELKPGTMGKAPPNLNAIGTPSTIETSDEPWIPNEHGRYPSNVVGEIADYQKYFYCPKVSRRERHRGFEQEHIPAPFGDVKGAYVDGERMAKVADDTQYANAGNNHPTVKPVELMKYLVKLVTAQGSHIVDPFSGSGSTGMACKELARTFTGIDLDPHYCEIARRRIAATKEDLSETLFDQD
jgi:DNA modification methylase